MNNAIKIVLAEDDSDDQEFFREALLQTAIPAELTIVDNGQKLMEKLKSIVTNRFDLIFLDLNMPFKNGIECLKEIRKDTSLKDSKCIVLTTTSNNNIKEETYKAGANLFLTKPDTFDNYIKIIRQALTTV